MPPSTVILIGPLAAGKSTVGRRLAARLGMPQQSLDSMNREYFAELGYEPARAEAILQAEGYRTCYRRRTKDGGP